MNEEGKMQQGTGHRSPVEAGDPRLWHDEIPAEQDHRSAGIGSLNLCEWKKIDNNDHSGKVGKSAGTRT